MPACRFHYWSLVLLAAVGPSALRAQVAAVPSRAGSPAAAEVLQAEITERGPHHRVVEWSSAGADAAGNSVTVTNSYTEVATGLHYLDERGQWQATVAEFVRVQDGFVAARGPHQVALANDLAAAGAVTVWTPEGRMLRNTPTLLAYVDHASGASVRLADLQSSRGELIAPNVVLYADAFDTVAADVRATYTAAGFECDVILRKQLPDPALLGLDPETTEVAVYSEWFETQPDRTETREAVVGKFRLPDATLSFGSLAMDRGRAFGLDEVSAPRRAEVTVRKEWTELAGRTYLIERAAYRALQPLLKDLPGAAAPTPEQRRRWQKLKATAGLNLPARKGVAPAWPHAANGRLIASLPPAADNVAQASRLPAEAFLSPATRHSSPSPGLVLDYTLVNTTTNYTFDGLTTYYVSGPVNLSGTVTFNAGTVIKYAATNSPGLNVLSGATLNWLGAPYRPVTLVSKDDTAAGEPLPGASGTPGGFYAAPALSLNNLGAITLTNLCVRNADTAILTTGTTSPTLRHGQFLKCRVGLQMERSATLQNLLFDSVTNVTWHTTTEYDSYGEFLTVDAASYLNYTAGGLLNLDSSLLVSVANTNSVVIRTNNHFAVTNEFPIFASAGSGTHYLEPSQLTNDYLPFFPSTSPQLSAELVGMTVETPVLLPNTILVNTLLTQRAIRDTGSTYIGYHYWPVDYLATGLSLTNATLTLTNGVVLGLYGGSGVVLQSGGKFISQGRPDALNRLAWASAVQEQATGGSTGGTRILIDVTTNASIWPELHCRFTQIDFAADTSGRRSIFNASLTNHWISAVEFSNCQVARGTLNFAPGGGSAAENLTLFNNVWQNCSVTAYRYWNANQLVSLRNNLFNGGSLSLQYTSYSSNPTWTVRDNLFVADSLSSSIPSAQLNGGYNGYTAGTATFGSVGNKTGLGQDFATGPLGRWYYPASGSSGSLAQLSNAGSQSAANAGLYHYTTQVSQAKEAGSTADIGFHYVAGRVAADAYTGYLAGL